MGQRYLLTRRDFIRGSAVGVAAFAGAGFIAACGGTSLPSKSGKGTITIGLGGQRFETLDTMARAIVESRSIVDALYDALIRIDTTTNGGGKVLPGLATSWKQVDPLTWEFAMRQGVKFHNGEDFDAATAAFSLHLVIDAPKGELRAWLQTLIGSIAKAEAIDARTLRIVTKVPDVLLVKELGSVPMYPKAYYQSVGFDAFGRKPVGTGQWKFDSWAGEDVALTRFDGYWGEKAKFDRLIYRPIPEATTRLAALLAGEIDIAYSINLDDRSVLEPKGFLVVPAPTAQAMGVDLIARADRLLDSPTQKKQVRQAMNYAVDKEAIVKDIMRGSTRALPGQSVGPDSFGFNPDVKAYPYDPDKAKQLLAEAGYPNGFTTTFQTAYANYTKAKEVSENVVAQLAKVGVNAKLEVLEWQSYVDKLLTGTSAPMIYHGLNYHQGMDAHFVIRQFASPNQFKLFSNARMDQLIAAQASEFDTQKREKLLQEYMAVAHDEAPALFLFQSPLLYGLNPRVQGFAATADNAPLVRGVSLRD